MRGVVSRRDAERKWRYDGGVGKMRMRGGQFKWLVEQARARRRQKPPYGCGGAGGKRKRVGLITYSFFTL